MTPTLKTAPTTCPECGSTLTFDPKCTVEQTVAEPYHLINLPMTVRLVTKRVVLCNGCEFAAFVR